MRQQNLLAIALALTAVHPLCAASISATVIDEKGSPVPSAAVVWVGLSAAQVGGLHSAGNAPPAIVSRGSGFSDTAGRFHTPDLPAATYLVCVTSLAQQAHLSTCEWRASQSVLSLTDQPQTLELVVQQGSILRFHVTDPKGRLTQQNLSIVVSAPNDGFAHARIISLTPSQAELFVAVPFNSKVAAVVSAPARLHDSKGASVPLRVPAMMMTISSEPARDISLILE